MVLSVTEFYNRSTDPSYPLPLWSGDGIVKERAALKLTKEIYLTKHHCTRGETSIRSGRICGLDRATHVCGLLLNVKESIVPNVLVHCKLGLEGRRAPQGSRLTEFDRRSFVPARQPHSPVVEGTPGAFGGSDVAIEKPLISLP
uniref:Uncharacterized protein n=1 Tax=Candidozyma auris TaxID=498019 RepID=A0A0L0NUD1_CANAR